MGVGYYTKKIHKVLSSTHSDSDAGEALRGDIITGQGATPKWKRLSIGTTGKVLTSDGIDVSWQPGSSVSGIENDIPKFAVSGLSSSIMKEFDGSISIPYLGTDKRSVLSVDQMQISHLDGGINIGGVDITENQLIIGSIGDNFVQRDTQKRWLYVAMSSSGKYQIAITAAISGVNDYLYVSSDYGVIWTQRAVNTSLWRYIAISENGKYQSALTSDSVYVSSNYGVTWTQIFFVGVAIGNSICMSSDGRIQIIASNTNYLCRSTDYGVTWNFILPSLSRDWIGVAMSSNGKIITGSAYNGYLYVSDDYGATWAQRGTSQQWSFVAMSSSGKYQTAISQSGSTGVFVSIDYGVTWTQKLSGVSIRYISMTRNGCIQIAVTSSTSIRISSDFGSTWVTKGSFTSGILRGVAVSSDGKILTLTTALSSTPYISYIYTSYASSHEKGNLKIDNGDLYFSAGKGIAFETWQAGTLAEVNYMVSVTYGKGKFVALSATGTNWVQWSQDGISWVSASLAENNTSLGLCYGNGKFVLVSQNGINRVQWSYDGIAWVTASATAAETWNGVVWGKDKYVAISYTGKIMYSFDAITWLSATEPGILSLTSITYGNGRFVAVSDSGTKRVIYSFDGITWLDVTVTTNQWNGLCYYNGKFVATAFSGAERVMWSFDAINWNYVVVPTSNNWAYVTGGNGKFVAVARSGSNRSMWSKDATTWNIMPLFESQTAFGICYGNGRFVTVAADSTNRVMYSGDSIDPVSCGIPNILVGDLKIDGGNLKLLTNGKGIDFQSGASLLSSTSGIRLSSNKALEIFGNSGTPTELLKIGNPTSGFYGFFSFDYSGNTTFRMNSVNTDFILGQKSVDMLYLTDYLIGISHFRVVDNLGEPMLKLYNGYPVNTYQLIGFGSQKTGITAPSCVVCGFKVTDESGYSKGDFIIGTRNTTGGSDIPVIRFAVKAPGDISILTDGIFLSFGVDSEIKLTHIHNDGLELTGNLIFKTVGGTKIGTGTSQLLAFWGTTPISQPATISDPSGGSTVDSESRTAINTIIDRLQAIGLIAT